MACSTYYTSKIHQKTTNNRLKIDPKSVQNRCKIGAKTDSDTKSASESVFGPILGPTWGHLGAQNRVMLGPCWPKNYFFEVPEGIRRSIWFWTPFKTLLGTILGRFWSPKSTQNRSRMCLKDEQAQIAKILKKHWFFNVFWGSEGSKIKQKSIKIAS